YYPFGGTAVWTARNEVEADYKTVRYSGKERDCTGLYYYGHRYYAPWLCRWVSADPAGEVDGLNLFRMIRNNPVTSYDITGFITHKELEQRGITAGIDIGKRLQQASINSASTIPAQIAEIKSMIFEFSRILTDYKLPKQKTGQVLKAYTSATSGNKNDYAKQYRSANPDQDELISTQTVYSIFSGISEHFKTAGITMTSDQESLVQAAFEFISLIRLPTKGSGYNLPGEVMQHPTSPKTLMFGSSGQNHGKADLDRRHEAILELEKNLSTAAPAAVMKPLLDMAEHMAKYTLQEFTGPATAKHMVTLPHINTAEKDEQTRGRDAMKHLSAIRQGQKNRRFNPIAVQGTVDATWSRRKLPPNAGNHRSFSPSRFA
uniref:RHS repeat-associated core domain-containing protein n=1 Tax=Pseudescherichia sp. TaxID=2055881 RepID=UPI00289EDD41